MNKILVPKSCDDIRLGGTRDNPNVSGSTELDLIIGHENLDKGERDREQTKGMLELGERTAPGIAE
jgi:hypothetical protein